jgi:hypothetical protein
MKSLMGFFIGIILFRGMGIAYAADLPSTRPLFSDSESARCFKSAVENVTELNLRALGTPTCYLRPLKYSVSPPQQDQSFCELTSLRREITEDDAIKIFDYLRNQSHIPFHFPEFGCFARAHEMAMLLEMMGIYSRKVFVEGDLRVKTEWSPKGEVKWRYHVAPILSVRTKSGQLKDMVIDPSLFDKPESIQVWTARQSQSECAIGNPQPYIPGTRPSSCVYYTRERFALYPPLELNRSNWLEADLSYSYETMRGYLPEAQRRESQRGFVRQRSVEQPILSRDGDTAQWMH